MIRQITLPYAALVVLATNAGGQSPASPRPAERLVGGWMGASVGSSSRWGTITDRRLFVAAFRAQYLLETFGRFALASTVDVVPVAVLSNTPEYSGWQGHVVDGTVVYTRPETGRSPVFGAGIIPAGLRLYTRSTGATRFFLGGSAGALWFTRNTPTPNARRMNVAVDLGAGAEIRSRDGRAMVVGYRFQHLSNAGTAPANPGVDAHLFYLGVMRIRGGRRNGSDETAVAR